MTQTIEAPVRGRGRPRREEARPAAQGLPQIEEDVVRDRGIVTAGHGTAFREFVHQVPGDPLLFLGNALDVVSALPDASVDCVITSPPYWGLREYENGGLGEEADWHQYVANLAAICAQVQRVLKPTGTFWLNLGDTYRHKSQVGVPWRVAIHLMDAQGWVLRNDVIWHKMKGPTNSRDRFRSTHEYLFAFTKRPTGYYFDAKAVAAAPREAQMKGDRMVSATGVTGVSYRRKIELSTVLSADEKTAAFAALDAVLADVSAGRLHDFRMVIRGASRTTHGDGEKTSGRARELQQKGFYFLKYHPDGTLPGDVWDVTPEDAQGRGVDAGAHFAPFPEDLVRTPMLATCPPGGVVLDPFSGTGTTCAVARQTGRRGVGIDVSAEYLVQSQRRWANLLL